MRLLADENLHRVIVAHLRNAGHDVISVSELSPGIPDEEVLGMANSNRCLLLTGDKDFGELAFRQNLVHHGVLLLRLTGLQTEDKAELVLKVLETHGTELEQAFTVITPTQIRIRKRQ
jgi:predicted nuclease of predicted toxin-antitoxin system